MLRPGRRSSPRRGRRRAASRAPSLVGRRRRAVSSSTPMPSSCGRLGDDHQQPAVAVALVEVLVDHGRASRPRPAATWVIRCFGVDAADAEGDHVRWTGCWRRPRCRPTTTPRAWAAHDRVAERGAADDRGQLELVAAGHEDAGGARRAAPTSVGVVRRPRGSRGRTGDDLGGARARGTARRTPRRPRGRARRRSGSPRSGRRRRRCAATKSLRMVRLRELVLGAADDHEGSPGHDREASGCHSGPVQRQPRQLVVMRHAKAEAAGPSDRERELTDARARRRGRGRAAGWPRRASARRTRWSPPPPAPGRPGRPSAGGRRAGPSSRDVDQGLYAAGPRPRSTWCAPCPTRSARLFVVGHNPTIGLPRAAARRRRGGRRGRRRGAAPRATRPPRSASSASTGRGPTSAPAPPGSSASTSGALAHRRPARPARPAARALCRQRGRSAVSAGALPPAGRPRRRARPTTGTVP